MAAPASLITASDTGGLPAKSPADQLRQRLDDPQVAAALSSILDHADLLAVMITGLDGLLRRAEVIGDSMASGFADLRSAVAPYATEISWPEIEVDELVGAVVRLSAGLVDAAPGLDRLLHSPLTNPHVAEVLADVGAAVVDGKEAAAADPRGPRGLFAMMRVAKDPDVSRGLGFMIHIARAFGRRLGQDPSADGRNPRRSAR